LLIKRKHQSDISIDDIINMAARIFKQDKKEIIAKKNSLSNTRKIVIYISEG